MISTLNGKLTEIDTTQIVIDCAGVGYVVTMAITSIGKLPATGSQVKIYTHLIVRADDHSLYGFLAPNERKLFKLLISISGIGPKNAINLLSSLDGSDLANAVEQNDVKVLTAVPGIGKKSAGRIINELRDNKHLAAGVSLAPQKTKALEALIALGYKQAAALKALSDLDISGKQIDQIIKNALAKLTGK